MFSLYDLYWTEAYQEPCLMQCGIMLINIFYYVDLIYHY